MLKTIVMLACLGAGGAAVAEDFSATLGAPWDGLTVPTGQQCRLFGGDGATPPIAVTGIPASTVVLFVEFNDKSYAPLSENGGHGVIGFMMDGDKADAILPPVPGMTADLPSGVFVNRSARSSGRYASAGYLPPCSGGRGNLYSADIIAYDESQHELGRVTVELGRY